MSITHTFTPELFTVSRDLDYFTLESLMRQLGDGPALWPLIVVKELADNALDDAEQHKVPPQLEITVTRKLIEVRDHGSGIPEDAIKGALDYSSHTSSRRTYVGPSRGQQGQALKTILAMGYALTGNAGLVEIEARGTLHQIALRADRIAQKVVVEHRHEASSVKNGTCARVHWPVSPWSIDLDEIGHFLPNLAAFNPHLRLEARIGKAEPEIHLPTNTAWQRWRPSEPPPVHWYTLERLAQLVAATIGKDRSCGKPVRLVRDFINEFRGLSATAKRKAVLDSFGLQRARLDVLVKDDAPNLAAIERLRLAMCDASKPPKPEALGIIGKDHWQAVLGNSTPIAPDSFQYKLIVGDDLTSPKIAEVCFAWMPAAEERRLLVGVNHSPALAGADAFGRLYLDGELAGQYAGDDEPVAIGLHLVAARLDFTDTGKTKVDLHPYSLFAGELREAVGKVTARWKKQRLAEIRNAHAERRRQDAVAKTAKPERITIKEAAWLVMAEAYRAASRSADGTRGLPANARQIMYAARRQILDMTGLDEFSDKYFTQTLLPDYIAEHPQECADWDVVFDKRGEFHEPHTGRVVDLSTLDVREYVTNLGEHVPREHFANVLYIEKAGFEALFTEAKLGERFDLGIIYAKGTSVVAARTLIDALAAVGVRTFCIRDFDVKGFEIARTLRDNTRRYAWSGEGAVDLGLRLDDVRHYDVDPERVSHKSGDKILRDPAAIHARIAPELHRAGASEEEIAFLIHRRVELNALPSGKLVEWVERRLVEQEVGKVIPAAARIEASAEAAIRSQYIRREMDRITARVMAKIEARFLPKITARAEELVQERATGKGDELRAAVEALLQREPELTWNAALTWVLPS